MVEVYGKAVASIQSTDDAKFGPTGGFTAVLSTPSEDRDGDRLFRDEWKQFTQERYPLDMDHGMTVADTIGSFVPYFDGEKMMMDAVFAKTPKAQEVRMLVSPDENGIRHISSVSVAFMTDKSRKSGEPQRELLNAGVVCIPSNRDAVILASKAASALKDAFSQASEDDALDEVKATVLEVLSAEEEAETKEPEEEPEKKGAVYLDVIPRFNVEAWQKMIDDLAAVGVKASQTASGVGGDGALVQAIHDASSHLGAGCPVIEVSDSGTGASSGANKDVETDVETKESTEAFEKALDEVLADDSPAEAAAASDEEPAPADEAADEKAKRSRALRIAQMTADLITT